LGVHPLLQGYANTGYLKLFPLPFIFSGCFVNANKKSWQSVGPFSKSRHKAQILGFKAKM